MRSYNYLTKLISKSGIDDFQTVQDLLYQHFPMELEVSEVEYKIYLSRNGIKPKRFDRKNVIPLWDSKKEQDSFINSYSELLYNQDLKTISLSKSKYGKVIATLITQNQKFIYKLADTYELHCITDEGILINGQELVGYHTFQCLSQDKLFKTLNKNPNMLYDSSRLKLSYYKDKFNLTLFGVYGFDLIDDMTWTRKVY